MLRMYCRVQPCTDFTRVHVENQTCSRGTVECNRVQIRHVYTLKIKVAPCDAGSIFSLPRVIRVSAWHACQHVVVEFQHIIRFS